MPLSPFFKKNTDSILAAFAGAFIIWMFTRHSGIGISPDSVYYSIAAESLRQQGTLTDFNHHPVVEFPALYPLFLASLQLVSGQSLLTIAPVLNALLFAIILLLSGWMMEQFSFRGRLLKIGILSILVFSPSLLELYSMLWSETVFILLLLLFFIALRRYLLSPTLQNICAAACFAALACVTRFAGVTFIMTGILLLFYQRNVLLRTKFVHAWLFSGISSSLLLCNLLRNHLVGGSLTGFRERAIRTVADNFHGMGLVLGDWLPFLKGYETWASAITIILLTSFTAYSVIILRRRKDLSAYPSIAAVFFVLYALFMIASASLTRYEAFSNRLLSPLFIPMIWVMGSWVNRLIKRKWMVLAAVAIFVSFQYYQLMADYETWDGVKDAGVPGYTEDQWTQSPTILYLQQHPELFNKGNILYSNAPDALYFFTQQQSQSLPHNDFLSERNTFLRATPVMVIWFNDGDNPDLVGKDFISSRKKMVLLQSFDDGAIYVDEQIPSPGK